MDLPWWLDERFLAVAVIVSCFYGARACDIFGVSTAGKSWSWWAHQFWLNASCAAFGWAALWFLGVKAWRCMLINCAAEVGFGDAFTVLFAIIGITGLLPQTLMGVIQRLKELAEKLTGS